MNEGKKNSERVGIKRKLCENDKVYFKDDDNDEKLSLLLKN